MNGAKEGMRERGKEGEREGRRERGGGGEERERRRNVSQSVRRGFKVKCCFLQSNFYICLDYLSTCFLVNNDSKFAGLRVAWLCVCVYSLCVFVSVCVYFVCVCVGMCVIDQDGFLS